MFKYIFQKCFMGLTQSSVGIKQWITKVKKILLGCSAYEVVQVCKAKLFIFENELAERLILIHREKKSKIRTGFEKKSKNRANPKYLTQFNNSSS